MTESETVPSEKPFKQPRKPMLVVALFGIAWFIFLFCMVWNHLSRNKAEVNTNETQGDAKTVTMNSVEPLIAQLPLNKPDQSR